ncbi:unnamed protein product [Brassicogethes aeneus]|uniref:Cytochrome P450 n=1 Tax=Brassicogethes aeneus TaxID=1431903 RepID=A0A9P0FKN8_BRAAE|nr:unnamed protein product [Brassicogethes aeneus]
MSYLIVLALVSCLTAIFYLSSWFYNHVRVRLYCKKVPGPKGYNYPVGHFFEFMHTDERLFMQLRKWALDYYPIYRLQPGPGLAINLIGPDDIEQIVSTTQHSTKSDIYRILSRWLGTGLLTATGLKWQQRRKILTPAFHFSILQKFIHVFNDETDNLVQNYLKLCENKQELSIDVVSSITQFTLYTINETSMGTKLTVQNKEDEDYKTTIYSLGTLLIARLFKPWLWRDWFYYYCTIDGYQEKKLLQKLHNFTNKVIQNKSKNFVPFKVEDDNSYSKRKNMALLDILLNEKFTNGSIDDEGIREEVDTFMFEGHDTTSMGISLGLMVLANHPDAQDLIYEEMKQILGDTSRPNYDQLMKLKYMERCIKEIQRLYPSVPFISRVLSEDVVTKSGYMLPKETIVNIHIFDLHRHPDHYEDPDVFNPDRFLPENTKHRHPFAFLPFSAGPRNCIGQRFAILEYKAVLCGILKHFKLEAIDTPASVIFIPDVVLRPKHGVRVKFVKRV